MDKCSQAKLVPLTRLLEEVRECVKEFNKLNTSSKVKRAMRASEFKEKFERYDTELTRIQTDLLLREVSGLSDQQAEAFKYQLTAAEAHRRDLEAMMEELRAENSRLMQQVEKSGSKEVEAAMGKLRSESKSALDALSSQAAEQRKLLEAMRAQGTVDMGELKVKMDRIAASAAANAAAAANLTVSASVTATATEKLALQHAEAAEELKALLKAAGAGASAEAKRLQDGMNATQATLKAAVNASNVQLKDALQTAQKSLSAEGKAAAKEILQNVEAVQVMTEAQMRLLGDVAKEAAAIKKTLEEVDKTASRIDGNVEKLLLQMQQLLIAKDTAPPDPQARKDALLAALGKARQRAAAVDAAMQGVYNGSPGEAVQAVLKSVQRAVQLVGVAALSLEEKTRMLPPALAPHMNVQKVEGALELCAGISVKTPAEVISDKLSPLRYALDQLAAANEEANAALSGAGSNAAAKLPPGWERELWTYAFTAFSFSGPLATLISAKSSGYAGPCDDARLVQFAMLKQQDAGLGGSSTVDVYEWAAMAQAAGDPITTALEASKSNSSGLEAQRLLDRFLAYANANKADDSFKIFVDLAGPGGGAVTNTTVMSRGMKTSAVGSTYRAKVCDPVHLSVMATQDCYFYLVEQDSSGALCPLVPWNATVPNVDNRLVANVSRPVPRQGDGFDIEFSPPAGLERVFVFGVKQPMERWGDLASIQNTTQRGEALIRTVVTKAAAPSASVASFQLTFQLYE